MVWSALAEEMAAVRVDDGLGLAEGAHLAVVEPEHAGAELGDGAQIMADEQNRAARQRAAHGSAPGSAPETAGRPRPAPRRAAARRDRRGRRRRSRGAPACPRVALHRSVHEALQPGELDDVGKALVDAAAGDAEDRGVQIDVVAAAQFGVEAGA